nr:hypothetical protein DBT41_11055 [Aerococcus urinae]
MRSNPEEPNPAIDHAGFGASVALKNGAPAAAHEAEEEVASYLFEMLIGARRLALARRHKFLAYLIGMAAEEARLLTQGRSASRA